MLLEFQSLATSCTHIAVVENSISRAKKQSVSSITNQNFPIQYKGDLCLVGSYKENVHLQVAQAVQ